MCKKMKRRERKLVSQALIANLVGGLSMLSALFASDKLSIADANAVLEDWIRSKTDQFAEHGFCEDRAAECMAIGIDWLSPDSQTEIATIAAYKP